MIITATPQPENFPPRIRLDIDSGGDEFLELTVLRDGRPIRQQPALMGLSETFVYDYEAPFGVPVTYSASGRTISDWGTAFTESWANLTDWTVVSGSPTVSGGRLGNGAVSRDDIAVTTGRVTLNNGSTAMNGLTVGPVAIQSTGAFSAGVPSTTMLVRFRGGPWATVPASNLSVDWTDTSCTVSHLSGTTQVVAGPGGPSSEIVAWGGSNDGMFNWPGTLAGFSYAEPAETDPFSVSATTMLDISEAWLIHPIQPSLSIPIERFSRGGEMSVAASTDETRTYASRQAIYQPNGRREAVSYPLGPRGAGSWTLVLTLENIEARNDLMTLLDDQAPVMLRSPSEADWDLPDGWYSVGDVDVSRPIDIGGVELRRATLPLTKVAEPPVKIAPQLTWGDLMLRGIKWGDLLSKTWLQALMGEV